MSVATIHDISAAARPPRPLRPAVDGPASLTITLRIDLPGGQLPDGAIDLVDSLRSAAAAREARRVRSVDRDRARRRVPPGRGGPGRGGGRVLTLDAP